MRDVPFEKDNTIDITVIPAYFLGIEPLYFFQLWSFLKVLKRLKPDVIHVENPTWSLVLLQAILTKLLVCPKAKIVVFTWLNMPYPRSWKFFLYKIIEWFNLKFIDHLICGNNDGKKLFTRWWFKKTISVMPQLWIDPHFFVPKNVAGLQKKLGIQEHDFIIWSIGRLVPEKWLLYLLDAFAHLIKKHPHGQLLLVGTWPQQTELSQHALRLGINKRIIWVHSVTHEEVVDYINCCDVHVLSSYEMPYRKEQFGHILIECMSCGVPVIGSDSGEIPYVIDDAWIIFPVKNSGKLSLAIEYLLVHPDLCQTYIKKAKKRVDNLYTHKKIAEQLDMVYQSLSPK